MVNSSLLLLILLGISGVFHPMAGAAPVGWNQETFTLHGRITDRAGNGVAGAEVALYTTTDVRRPVDFLAPSTNIDGGYALAVPPGKYWVVARKRQSSRYGALQPTDRHSGAPVEIVGEPGKTVSANFTIATLREMGEGQPLTAMAMATLKGRICDGEGAPVANAYMFARKERAGGGIPDLISPTADRNGETTLLLRPGRYFIGTDLVFPPREGSPLKEILLGSEEREISVNMEVSQ